jgi:UDP-N-acetylmuramate dehydrogenase
VSAAAGLTILEQVPLAPLTTLGIGGSARYYTRATRADHVAAAATWAGERGLELLVLGGGSNLLVADAGFDGLVLEVALRGVDWRESGGDVQLSAAAGEDWDALVALGVERGWAGFECLSGIPGRVGATPIQNVGAYGQDVGQTLTSVTAWDRSSQARAVLEAAQCGFGYRHSRFKAGDRERFVILEVSYSLRRGGAPALRYAELERYLAEHGCTRPALADVREAVLALRRRKAMLLDPADPNTRSVGSFFVNPVVSAQEHAALEAAERRLGLGQGERMPAFPASGGAVKLSAAWLIERAGFRRGERRGDVGISERHCLALVNRGGGTAAEVVSLAREIRARVRDRFGITLQPEPVLVGFRPDQRL